MGDEPRPTFAPAPPEHLPLSEGRALVRLRPARTASSVEAINASLDHLAPWMAWASQPATEESVGTFLAEAESGWDEGHDFGYAVVEGSGADERVVGGCGLHGRIGPNGLEVGYWVAVDRAGHGLATEIARALTDAAFGIAAVERVRICCEEANVRSARVPEKLGYRYLGLEVPEGGPCEGRSTQIWEVERAAWQP
ncbi:MAG: GNAT family N-acetyltransferase [Acidimicrobiales bacterium]